MAINRINNSGQNKNNTSDNNVVYNNVKNAVNDLNSFLVVARVTDIVLNDQHEYFNNVGRYNGIGAIYYEIVNQSGTNTDSNGNDNFALPYDPHIKSYPLVNEYVVLIKLPNNQTGNLTAAVSYFYLSPVNLWNHPHCDPYPNPLPVDTKEPQPQQLDYSAVSSLDNPVRQTNNSDTYDPNSELNSKRNPSQNTFIEQSNIHPLLPFMGDTLMEGRYGQSIRFGSTVKSKSTQQTPEINNNWSSNGDSGDPITILRNGQPTKVSDLGWLPITENIKNDLSSIYLTSYQKIPFSISNENFVSYTTPPTTPSQFVNPQIILNSDRIVLNAKTDSVLISGQNSVGISSNNSVNIESTSEIDIASKLVKLGSANASQAVLRGDETVEYLKILITELQNLSEALKVIQDWPGGVPAPNPIILATANSSLQVFQTIYSEIDSVKSKIVKTV
jgi:hypothetical protein